MTSARKILLGLAAAVAVSGAVPAFAQITEVPAYTMIIYPNGRMVSVPLDKKMTDDAMTHAKAVDKPMMVMLSGGKAYMVEDSKMADGKSMIDWMGSQYKLAY